MKRAILKRALIVAAVVALSIGFRNVRTKSAPPALPQKSDPTHEELERINFSTDAHWVMADVPWSLRFRQESGPDIGIDVATYSPDSPALENESLSGVLPYLSIATQATRQSNGLVLHKLQRENLQAEVLTTDGEPKKILAAMMSRPDASGNWLTFELRPNRSGHALLLDLPPPCSVKATRFSEDGSTAQFQLLANVRFEALAQFLDLQGWRIHSGSRHGESFRCEKAGREFELTRLTNDSVLLRVCS